MTITLLVTCSALLLKHQDLVALEVLEDFTLYRGAFYNRCAYLNLTAIVYQQDFVEAHRRVFLA